MAILAIKCQSLSNISFMWEILSLAEIFPASIGALLKIYIQHNVGAPSDASDPNTGQVIAEI